MKQFWPRLISSSPSSSIPVSHHRCFLLLLQFWPTNNLKQHFLLLLQIKAPHLPFYFILFSLLIFSPNFLIRFSHPIFSPSKHLLSLITASHVYRSPTPPWPAEAANLLLRRHQNRTSYRSERPCDAVGNYWERKSYGGGDIEEESC